MLKTVGVKLIADIGDFIGKMREAGRSARDLASELDKAAKAGNLDNLADSALKAGAAISAGVGLAIAAGARFEQQMSEVGAVAEASGAALDALGQAALKAGADTSFSATEAAKAEAELAKAGLTATQIIGGALSGALDLAAAGSLDLAEAADVAAKTMNIFDLSGRDVTHIADVLAAAANKSATDVHELGAALRQGGLAAKNADLSLEETVGTFAAFADNALVGSDAGTSFKQMLQQLAAPSQKASDLMDELGLEAYDAQGNFIGLEALAGQLQDRLGGLTKEQRDSALAIIFGADAMRAATVLYNEGAEGIADYTASVDDMGAAQEVAQAKTDNLIGDLERLKGSLETLFITSSEGANGGLRFLVQRIEDFTDGIGKLPDPILNVTTVLAGLTGAAALGAGAYLKARSGLQRLNAELAATGPLGARAASGLGRVGRFLGGPWGIAIGLATTAVLTFAGAQDTASDATEELIGTLDEQTGALTRTSRAWVAHRLEQEGVLESAQQLGIDLEDLVNVVIHGGDAVKFVADQMRAMGQDADIADEALVLYNKDAADTSDKVLEMQAVLAAAQAEWQRLNEATGGAKTKMEALDPATRNLARGLGLSADSAEDFTDQLEELDGELDAVIESIFGLSNAQDDLQDAIDSLTEGIREQRDANVEGAGSFEGMSKAARENRDNLQDVLEKLAALTLETIEHTGSTQEARAAVDDFKARMAILADQLGIDISQVEGYNEVVAQIERLIDVQIRTNTQSARQQVLGFQSWLNSHPLQATVNFGIGQRNVGLFAGAGFREGGVVEHAASGLLSQSRMFPAGPTLYAFAEPETGGEAFIAKNAPHQRSLAIADEAARWHGGMVVPRDAWYGRAGMSGGGVTNTYTFGDISITVPVDQLDQLRTVEEFADFLDNLRNNSRRGGKVKA